MRALHKRRVCQCARLLQVCPSARLAGACISRKLFWAQGLHHHLLRCPMHLRVRLLQPCRMGLRALLLRAQACASSACPRSPAWSLATRRPTPTCASRRPPATTPPPRAPGTRRTPAAASASTPRCAPLPHQRPSQTPVARLARGGPRPPPALVLLGARPSRTNALPKPLSRAWHEEGPGRRQRFCSSVRAPPAPPTVNPKCLIISAHWCASCTGCASLLP